MICILGSDSFSFYLACKLQETNQEVFVLSTKSEAKKHSITIKEEGKFQKKQYEIDVKHHLDVEPDFLIISCPKELLKTEIIALRKSLLINTPTICLSGLKDAKLINELLNKNIELGYFEGGFNKKNDFINVNGLGAILYLTSDCSFLEVLKKTDLKVETKENQEILFWKWFSIFSITFILNCLYKKSVFELSKNKDYRELIEKLVNEISETSPLKNNKSFEILSNITSISNQTVYKFSFTEINFINNTLKENLNEKNELNKLIKTIYKTHVL
ncbi:MAG: hypothetical protein R3Y43_06595 [Alphaproteobacteria bacterium]